MAIAKDLTGLTIGDWYVIERGPVINGHTMWRCRCKCGTIRLVDGYSLTHEISLSCGCRRHLSTGRPSENACGKKYGLATGLRRIPCHKRPRYEWQCECGKIFQAYLSSVKSGRVASCGCYKSKLMSLLNWKGGVLHDRGYVLVWDPKNQDARKNGYILLHRKVMAEILGRRLKRSETVHHKNGIKDDNVPSNLELRSGNHGKGASVGDKMLWSVAFLREYLPDIDKLKVPEVRTGILELAAAIQ